MEKLIACCGLDCAACDARTATLTNNNELRAQIAEKWKTEYHVPNITADMINCTGCMEEGAKIGHCAECKIRICVIEKGFRTCSDCDLLGDCEVVGNMHKFVPEALNNLKSLN
jgi:predicted nucleic acid binding AN1-type Zn finger protein